MSQGNVHFVSLSMPTPISSDAHAACRLLSLSAVIVSALSIVLQGPLTPPPSSVAQSVSQKEELAVDKADPPAPVAVATQKRLGKKPGSKGKLTLETYTRCVARALDVDEPLAVSVLIQESDARNPMRTGRRGSLGPLQVQPIALEEVGLSRHERSLPILVYGGLRYLKTMMSRFDNLQTALAAYNMGPTSLVKRDYRPYSVTQRYVRQVLNRAGKIRAGHVPFYPVLQYPLSQRDLSSRHRKIAPLQTCLVVL